MLFVLAFLGSMDLYYSGFVLISCPGPVFNIRCWVLATRYARHFRLIDLVLTSGQFHNLLCPIVSSIFAGNGIVGRFSSLYE